MVARCDAILRAEMAARASAFVVTLSSAVILCLIYGVERKWRKFETFPFLSDASYDRFVHPLFVLFATLTSGTLLVTVWLTRLAQAQSSQCIRSSESMSMLSYRSIADVGFWAGAGGCICSAVTSAISANSAIHFWLAVLSFFLIFLWFALLSYVPPDTIYGFETHMQCSSRNLRFGMTSFAAMTGFAALGWAAFSLSSPKHLSASAICEYVIILSSACFLWTLSFQLRGYSFYISRGIETTIGQTLESIGIDLDNDIELE